MTYEGYDVLDIRPPRIFDVSESVANHSSILEGVGGNVGITWLSLAHPWSGQIELFCGDRTAIQAVRDFVAARKGQYLPFWVPSWNNDFQLRLAAGSGATALTTIYSGLSATGEHVAVITVGAIYPRGIVSYVPAGNAATLTVNSAIPEALSPRSTMVSYLRLVRLAADAVSFEFTSMNSCDVILPIIEVEA